MVWKQFTLLRENRSVLLVKVWAILNVMLERQRQGICQQKSVVGAAITA